MCKKSESIKELAVALAKFNANVQRIEKDATNPHYKNRYTTLDAILDEVRPMLAEQGLSIIQMPSGDAEQLKLTTMLVHISGEWIESDSITMRPTKNDPQGIGSATTYARRYGLCAFLGLSTGDVDDDGNSASHVPQAAQSAPRSQAYSQPSTTTATAIVPSSAPKTDYVISDKQVTLIKTRMSVKNIPSAWLADIINDKYGTASVKNLTKKQMDELLVLMDAYMPAPDPNNDDLPF